MHKDNATFHMFRWRTLHAYDNHKHITSERGLATYVPDSVRSRLHNDIYYMVSVFDEATQED